MKRTNWLPVGRFTQWCRHFVVVHDSLYSAVTYSQRFPFKFVRCYFRERYIKSQYKTLEENVSFKPERVDIETTSLCNTSCCFCPYSKMKREKKHMNDDIFDKCLSEVKKYDIKNVGLSNFGEPTIDPKFSERVEKTKKDYNCTTRVSTNALQLTKQKSKEMIESGLDVLLISLDAVDSESFNKIRKGSFEKTVNNIEQLVSLKREMKSNIPYISLRIMVSSKSRKDAKKFVKIWKDRVDDISFGRIHTWCKGNTKLVNSPCLFLWSSLFILTNGDVVPCCMDYEGKLKLGNIMENSLEEIWNGEEIKKLREQHINRTFKGVCATCDINEGTIAKWWSYE